MRFLKGAAFSSYAGCIANCASCVVLDRLVASGPTRGMDHGLYRAAAIPPLRHWYRWHRFFCTERGLERIFSGQPIALATWFGVEALARARVCPLYRDSVARHGRGQPSRA